MPARRRRRRREAPVVIDPTLVMDDPEIAKTLAEAPRSARMPTHVPPMVRRRGVEAAREWATAAAAETRKRIAELSARAPEAVTALGPEAVEAWACAWDDPRRVLRDQVAAECGEADPLAPLPR